MIEYKKEAFRAFDHLNTIIKSETVEKLMRVQLVAEGAEEALEKMRPEEADLDELNYTAPDENIQQFSDLDGAGESAAPAAEAAPQKRRMVAGPSRQSDKPLNRAERRRQK